MIKRLIILAVSLFFLLTNCSSDTPSGDTMDDALPYSIGQSTQGSFSAAGNFIFYSFTVNAEAYHEFFLDNLTGDMDLFLLDTEGYILSSSEAFYLANEYVSSFLVPGNYLIAIRSYESGSYRLWSKKSTIRIDITATPGLLTHPDINAYYTTNDTTVSISYSATDPNGIAKVEFLYSSSSTGEILLDQTTASSGTFNTTITNPGYGTLSVRALSGNGESFTHNISIFSIVPNSFIIENTNNTHTFLVKPDSFYPDATGHKIYLAGEMNSWAGSEVSVFTLPNAYSIEMTNRSDGTFVGIASNVSSGMTYKYIIDYNDNNHMDHDTEWKLDPGNPFERFTDANNSVVP